MHDLTDADFYYDEVVVDSILPGVLTIAYFTTPTCGPCRMLKPRLEELETENEGLTVTRIDAYDYPTLAEEHGVRSVPTLLLYVGGELAERIDGIKPKKTLQEIFNNYL